MIVYMIPSTSVSGKTSRRKKRGSGAMPIYEEDRDSYVTAYKCYYTDCIPPPDPDTIPPTCTRPSNATKWSDVASWQSAEAGWGGNLGNGAFGLPKQGDKVKIPKGQYIGIYNDMIYVESSEVYILFKIL
jgi:hypothetical protein